MQPSKEELFSFNFILRKRVNEFDSIVSALQTLEDSGYSCFMTLTGYNSRCLEVHLYENSTEHSTLTFCKLLKSTTPSAEEISAVSKVNFSISHNAKLLFECNSKFTQLTVKVLAPTDELQKKAIIDNLSLY